MFVSAAVKFVAPVWSVVIRLLLNVCHADAMELSALKLVDMVCKVVSALDMTVSALLTSVLPCHWFVACESERPLAVAVLPPPERVSVLPLASTLSV